MISCRSSLKLCTYYFPSEPGTAGFDISGLYSPSQPSHFPIPDDVLDAERKEEIVKENYTKLQKKQKEALDSLKETVSTAASSASSGSPPAASSASTEGKHCKGSYFRVQRPQHPSEESCSSHRGIRSHRRWRFERSLLVILGHIFVPK